MRPCGSSTLCAPHCGHLVKVEMQTLPCGLHAMCQVFSNLLGLCLASTCFGIRKNIFCCSIISKEEVECEDFERLEFSGDVYVWDKDGRRKMIEPEEDKEWDDYYCEKCKYVEP